MLTGINIQAALAYDLTSNGAEAQKKQKKDDFGLAFCHCSL